MNDMQEEVRKQMAQLRVAHQAEAKAMAVRLEYWSGSYSMDISEVEDAMHRDLRAAAAFLRLIAEEL